MAKITLNNVASGFVSTTLINANNDAIEVAFENTLSRNGQGPNQMDANLDMNGNLILNQANPIHVDGFNWEGPWITGTHYQVGDAVENNNSSYIAIVDHIAGASFAADLAALRWQVIASSSNLPAQAGHAGDILSTDGATASWVDVNTLALPITGGTLTGTLNGTDANFSGSVTMDGTSSANTPAFGTSTNQIATTDFVYANANRPAFFPLSASVAGNALTFTLNPCLIDFRSSTLTSGAVTSRQVLAPITTTISAGSTGGTLAATFHRIYVLAMDVPGTVELAWVNTSGLNQLYESNLVTTTAEGGAGAADSNTTIYSTIARTNVPYRIVGFVDVQEAVPGTWNVAPTLVQGAGGEVLNSLYGLGNGQNWTNVTGSRAGATTYTNTTGRSIQVSVSLATSAGCTIQYTVGAVTGSGSSYNAAGGTTYASFVVPHLFSYSVVNNFGTSVPAVWLELR